MNYNTSRAMAIVIFLLIAISCNKKNDNDPEPGTTFDAQVSVSASSSIVSENVGTVEFTVLLDQPNTTSERIPIALILSGSATPETDFTGSVSSIDIPVNQNSAILSLFITDDEEEEVDETIVVTISSQQVDGITNGNSTATITITDNDQAESECVNDNSLSTSDIGCPNANPGTSEYSESISEDIRNISSNTVPNHIYGDARNQFSMIQRNHTLDVTPAKASTTTSILSDTQRPRYLFGIALNGVIYAPAPATPFIFENTLTGEYNWDWVFEPTTNKGPENSQVKLDCSSAHISGEGYHYHGNMFQYVETIQTGLSTGTVPSEPVQVGWAADGFPIVYQYGPDATGTLKKLIPSYQVKTGNRPGDGISAPCGVYNGKYTVDWEYIDNLGDLDACNGIEREITLTTPSGEETFDYFYVITEEFPQIGRCFVGTPDESFR